MTHTKHWADSYAQPEINVKPSSNYKTSTLTIHPEINNVKPNLTCYPATPPQQPPCTVNIPKNIQHHNSDEKVFWIVRDAPLTDKPETTQNQPAATN